MKGNHDIIPKSLKGLQLFWLLCLVWWIIGGVLLAIYGNNELFKTIHTFYGDTANVLFQYITYFGDFVTIGPILLLILFCIKKYRNLPFFILLIFTQLFPFLIVQGLKLWVSAPRPVWVFGGETWFHRIEGLQLHTAMSFPSGHTAGAFSFLTLLSLLLSAKNAVWSVLFFLSGLLVAYSRIYLGQHFYIDIYAGSISGTVLTTLFFRLWQYLFQAKPNKMTVF